MLELWALFAFSMVVGLTAGGAVLTSYVLGSRRRGRWTHEPYDGGIETYSGGWMRYGARFYLVAVLFVIFDVESAFVYAWAVSVREAGWAGFAELLVFIALLGLGLLYVWRNGALDFATPMRAERRFAIDTAFGPQPPLAEGSREPPPRQAGS